MSALAIRREKLERSLTELLDTFAGSTYSLSELADMKGTFRQLAGKVADYLSDKMDALRRSLLGA